MQEQQHRDSEVYSRQQLIVGQHGMKRIFQSHLCIVGLDGLGVEIAKNSLLAGVSTLTLCDNKAISLLDISNNLCLRNKTYSLSERKLRAQESIPILQKFNPYASISIRGNFEIDKDFKPDLVVCNQRWSEAINISDKCKSHNVPIIFGFTGGLYYLIALDLGKYKFLDIVDYKQSVHPIQSVTQKDGWYEIKTEEVNSLDTNDNVMIIDKDGKNIGKATVTSIIDDQSFFLLSSFNISSSCYFQFDPVEVEITFPSISEIPEDKTIAGKLLKGIKNIEKFIDECQPRNRSDFEKFFATLGVETEEEEIYERFYNTSFASTVGIDCVSGGLISEQVIKVLSRCYRPLEKLSGRNFFKNMYIENLSTEDCTFSGPDELYASQILTFGKEFQKKIMGTSAIVIGAGALGNEFIKNAAMVGMSTLPETKLIVVDNDLIMTSNLSRQLCFFEEDIYKPKAATLCDKAKNLFNSNLNVVPLEIKLEHTTEDQIGHENFSKMDVFITALDNVEARNTVERITKMYNKPMIDGGTEGFEGNQETFIPLQTAEYYSAPSGITESCTPKPIVRTQRDVIQNAKLHFEKFLEIVRKGVEKSYFELFLKVQITKVWEVYRVPATSFRNGVYPSMEGIKEMKDDFERSIDEVLKLSNLEEFFDKDEPAHVKLLCLMCESISRIYEVPPPSVLEIRKKAGRIIPNIISTTSIISGLMLMSALQAQFDKPQFMNSFLTEGSLRVCSVAPPVGDNSSITNFGKLQPTTTVEEVVKSLKSKYPTVDEIFIFANSTLSFSGRNIAKIMNKSISTIIREKCVLGTRKFIVAKVDLSKMERIGKDITIENESKYVILEL